MKCNEIWFKNAKYGLMIHWGLYSILGGIYKNKKSSNYAEWIMSYFKISNKEMENLAKEWQPDKFDAKDIVDFAIKCGMKYIVITTKHHDGFAMFESNVDTYNIARFTKLNRDILKELADECHSKNIKLGIYYSQDIDWHDINGGGYKTPVVNCAGTSWDNNWDFPNQNKKNFKKYFYKKALPQIKELMQNYGEISLAWFDMPLTLSKKQSHKIYKLCKKYQPNILINSRLGNGKYDYVSLGDNEILNEINIVNKNTNNNEINGFKFSKNSLYESACTLNNSWGYSKWDFNYKSANEIYNTKNHLNKLGINFLINIGLDQYGQIPNDAREILIKAKEME